MDLKVFRPESTFSDFEIALTGLEKETGQKVFIQISTQRHFSCKEQTNYNNKLNSFILKQKIYNLFIDEVKKHDPLASNNLIKVKSFNYNKDYLIFISEYRNFTPLFKLIDGGAISEDDKKKFIKDLLFYKKIFNKCNIFWLDATPHNIMINKDNFKIVPVDFANSRVGDVDEVERINNISFKKLEFYFKNGQYNWGEII